MSDEEKAKELGYPESTIQTLLRLRREAEEKRKPKPEPVRVTGVDLPQACLDKLDAWMSKKGKG